MLTHVTQQGQAATFDIQIGRFVYRVRMTIVREIEERKVLPLPRPRVTRSVATEVHGPGNC